ncbi:MAG: glycosyl transferase group 1 [Bacteroidetes bacterium]|nr:glycosyl transferase group 1 [Bacteroidota bacterium]
MSIYNTRDQIPMIGLFNDSFPPIMDGVAVATYNTAYWLYRMNQPVCVVTPKAPNYIISEPYPVYRYSSLPLFTRKPYRLGLPEIDLTFQNKLDRIPFGLVHAHCPFTSGQLALRIARERNIPLVATFHSKYKDDFERAIPNKTVVSLLMKELIRFYEKADEVWIPQAAVEETIRQYGYKGQVTVVENGNDFAGMPNVDVFKTASRREMNIPTNKPVFLFVGQHIWEKNTALIIDSLAMLRDMDYCMFFIGAGYAADEMKQRVAEAGIQDKVKFEGVVLDRNVLKKYYAAADVFLFPSVYDNAPLVVREAAAMQTPAILVKGSTASEIIGDGINGFLIENSPQALASKLRSLMSDKASLHKAGQNAAATIARSWEDVSAEVHSRYLNLIDRKVTNYRKNA